MSSARKSLIFIAVLLLSASASAESFGDPNDPIPNVTEISIYDVTDESTEQGNEIGGTLEDSGLNKTFKVSQQTTRDYRFEFEIINDGSQTWSIESTDEMFHRNLNDSWTVNKIWFNITADGQDYDGGTFSGGRVDWDLARSGNVELANGDTMYAKYIVSVTEPRTVNFSEYFEVNETTTVGGSFDYHKFNVEKLGYMNLSLFEPPNDSIVAQNQSFLMNGSVKCVDGKCGTVTVTPRYNASSTADTQIPNDDTSEPFNTNRSSRSFDIARGEQKFTNFSVNASGDYESYHLLDYEASSSKSIENNDSEDHLVQINSAVEINLNWSNIDFGPLQPGDADKPAENNSDYLYNITVDERSESIDDLWIRATQMNSSELNYNISPENLSVSTENDISTEVNLSSTYQNLASTLSPGDVLTTFYWIDVPLGIYKGDYSGKIFFKANSTG